MTKVDRWASTEYGPVTMLFVDAGSEIAAIAFFIIVLMIVRPGNEPIPRAQAPAEPELPRAAIVN